MTKIEPNLGSKWNWRWRLGWNESESIESFWHVKTFSHQIKDQALINRITFIRFCDLKD